MAKSTHDDLFYRLTPDEIIGAVTQLGLEPSGHIAQLNSMENRVFDLRLEGGEHVVTKFYRPGRWTREQVLEEHLFLADLAHDEVPALGPLSIGGETLFSEQGIFFALWPRTGGREPEELSEIDLQILGRLTARLHNTGSGRSMQTRPAFGTERFIREPLQVLQQKGFLSEPHESAYTEIAEQVSQAYLAGAHELPQLRIHGDLHKGNILCGPSGWFLLDFDDCLQGPALQDIWMMFSGREAHERDLFLEAYREFRDFDENWLRFAEILRAMRIIHYSGWIARRYEDPAFQQAFPDFASDQYWEEELRVLRGIVAEVPGNTPGHNEESLGNKDYFFDWED